MGWRNQRVMSHESSTVPCGQEQEAEALGAAPAPDEPVETEEENSDAGSSSSEQFGFGFTGKASKAAKKGGKDTKGKAKARAEKQGHKEKAASEPPAAAPVSTLPAKIQKGGILLETLKGVSPQAIWQGSLKEKDLEVKLQKALEITDQLRNDSSASTVPEAVKLADGLEAEATVISAQLSTLSAARVMLETIGKEDGNEPSVELLVPNICKLPTDCITTMMTQLGRVHTEATQTCGSVVRGCSDS